MARAGLEGVTVGLTDYRDVTGVFDAVASIEMVEAVGQDYWPAYLATIARVLKPGGRAAIQYIAIDDAIFDRRAQHEGDVLVGRALDCTASQTGQCAQ